MIARGTAAVLATLSWACLAEEARAAQDPDLEAAASSPASEASSGLTNYPRSFFDQFLPNNANDMVSKLPGFTFNKGDDVRGFGGAAGNVLIDGERPSSKAVPLDQVLQRLPANRVVRIDLIRGGAPGIDMQGQSVVANIIRQPGADSSTTIQLLGKTYEDGQSTVIPRIEQSYRAGRFSMESQLFVRKDKNFDTGTGRLTRDGINGPESGKFDTDVQNNIYQANTAMEYRLGNGDMARFNLSGERTDTLRNEYGFPFAQRTGISHLERTRIKLRNDKGEIGGDYQHAFNSWLSGQVIALQTLKRDILRAANDGRGTPLSSFELGDTRERIGRVVMTAAASDRMRIEFGGEGAMNRLIQHTALTLGGVPVVLPSASVTVEETRGEGFASVNNRMSDDLTVEFGTRVETSTIKQSGGANKSRSLTFVKPRAILAWSPTDNSQVRLRVERQVGQLNFKDFAASSALEAGTVNAGNPDLLPDRSWVYEVALERRFWGSAVAVISAAHADIQDVTDLVPVGGFDAPGNIGAGTKDELKFSLTLPLDKLGIKNGQVRFNGTWRWSRVIDPVTGIERRISYNRPFEGDFYIGKQLPKLKSSINFDGNFGFNETSYRISEIRRMQETPFVKLYWDWAPRPDLNFRFQVENTIGKDRSRYRTLFTGPRSANVAAVKEARNAHLPPFFVIRMRKTL